MPVIVPPEAFDFWPDCAKDNAATAAALIAPPPDDLLECYEVSPAVNRAANDFSAPIAPALQAGDRAAQPPAAETKRKKGNDQPSLF